MQKHPSRIKIVNVKKDEMLLPIHADDNDDLDDMHYYGKPKPVMPQVPISQLPANFNTLQNASKARADSMDFTLP